MENTWRANGSTRPLRKPDAMSLSDELPSGRQSLTGDRDAIGCLRLLRQSEEEAEYSGDRVEAEQGLTEGLVHSTQRRVRATVAGNDVGMEVKTVEGHAVQSTRDFPTDPQRLI